MLLHPDFVPYRKKAEELIRTMTMEEKVGQLFLGHCPSNPEEIIKKYHLGGFVLFARDFEGKTKEQIKEETEAYSRMSKIPMLMSVDEEGGSVVRISKYKAFRDEPFLSPKELYSRFGWEGVAQEAKEKALLLKELGIFLNLAPVCDYTIDEKTYIAKRVFGKSPEEEARFIRMTVEISRENGIAQTLKHFPGYGGNTDTHQDMAYDKRSFSCFEQEDFLPFEAGIQAGAECVMVSHNIVQCMDAEYPSSLSAPVHRLLRERFGFGGVVITDSLTMNAIRRFSGGSDPCPLALQCGNDFIITSHYAEGYEAILKEYRDGKIQEETIRAALIRILCLKASLGLL